jgi:glucose-1-phosphate cytidylyltransferase
MKVVILAGGLGTRLMEETESRPKPMVDIGGKPILWHIMKIYEAQGYNDFIICTGYKSAFIKEYFLNYFTHNSDFKIDLKNNNVEIINSNTETFKVTLVDTGLNTNTAGRIKKISHLIQEDTFMLTYGDGVANINLNSLLEFHKNSGKIATLTSVQLPGRFGNIEVDPKGIVKEFQEKPFGDGVWINGGFFILNKGVFKYLNGDVDSIQWEKGPLIKIAEDGELAAYRHQGFWKCMDALRDRIELEDLWNSGKAEWKIWK